MTTNPVTHSFCIQSLHHAYHVLGYEMVMKEILFLHHQDLIKEQVHVPDPDTESDSKTISISPPSQKLGRIKKPVPAYSPPLEPQEENDTSSTKSDEMDEDSFFYSQFEYNPETNMFHPKNTAIIPPEDYLVHPDYTPCAFQYPDGYSCPIKPATHKRNTNKLCHQHYKQDRKNRGKKK